MLEQYDFNCLRKHTQREWTSYNAANGVEGRGCEKGGGVLIGIVRLLWEKSEE